MIEFKFKKDKALEAISFLLEKAENNILDVIVIVKMIYFANRDCLLRYNFALTGGDLYSLPYGPIISEVLNIINGNGNNIFRREGECVTLQNKIEDKSLSEAEIEVLEDSFKKYGKYTIAELIDYCHDKRFVPEWKDPGYSRKFIDPSDLLIYLGKTHEEINEIKESIEEEYYFMEAVSRYK